ncbi:hypothetical protein ES319_A01G112100v1 [Gossypium barbadense]|uniref:Uncharacterized protein n=1 Tax=Gossypium barbadense TaxID=3634 RepID=A0A5J5WYR8_GOSBA|nr:hypothetical protein ES319_A01G112100v1 [Gossypium barbadense]
MLVNDQIRLKKKKTIRLPLKNEIRLLFLCFKRITMVRAILLGTCKKIRQ